MEQTTAINTDIPAYPSFLRTNTYTDSTLDETLEGGQGRSGLESRIEMPDATKLLKYLNVGIVKFQDGSVQTYYKTEGQRDDLEQKVEKLKEDYQAFLREEGDEAGRYFSEQTGRRRRKIVGYGISFFDSKSMRGRAPIAAVDLFPNEAIMIEHVDVEKMHESMAKALGSSYTPEILKTYAYLHELAHMYQEWGDEQAMERDVETMLMGYFKKKMKSTEGEEQKKYQALLDMAKKRYEKVEKNYPKASLRGRSGRSSRKSKRRARRS